MVPRIATAHMRTCKGGFFQGYTRQGKAYTVDCTPARAVKTDHDMIQKNGVCLPIVNPRK